MLEGLWTGGGVNADILKRAKIQNSTEIKQVLGIDSGFDPARCILGILPNKRMGGDVTYLLRIMPLIAKKIITVFLVEASAP